MITADQLSKGLKVVINPQSDRSREVLIEGVLDKILTRSNAHPHGILVSLDSGEKGRVKSLITETGAASTPEATAPEKDVIQVKNEIAIPLWLNTENPYFVRDIELLKLQLNKNYVSEDWRNIYYEGGVCGCLQEMTKSIESVVESIFKMPIFLINEQNEMATLIYGRVSNGYSPTYRFASSTDLLAKLQFVFNDTRKKEKLIDLANYIDSDLGLFLEKIDRLDSAAVASLNAVRNYRNYLSHPQNDVLSQSKTRFIVDYSLVDFQEIYNLNVGIR